MTVLSIISNSATYVFVCAGVVYFWALIGKQRAIRGSHQRYVAASLAVMSSAAVTLTHVVFVAMHIANSELGWAVFFAFFGIRWYYWFQEALRDNDNWFNDQFKRLKKKWRKLRSWRPHIPRIASPRPAPSPN